MASDQKSKIISVASAHSLKGRGDENKGRSRRRMSDLSQGPGLMEMVAGDDPEEEGDKLGARSSSVINFYPARCDGCCSCLSSGPLQQDASKLDVCIDFFSCPPKGLFGRLILITFIFTFLWGFFFYLLRALSELEEAVYDLNGRLVKIKLEPHREFNPAWVYGPVFALIVILVSGLAFGVLLKRYLNLPPLLGPLILGIIFNNIEEINVFHLMKSFNLRECHKMPPGLAQNICFDQANHSVNRWIKPIRIIALGLILTRAGLELSPKQLRKLKGIVPLLAFGPCVVEACACASMCYVFFNVLEDIVLDKMGIAMCFVGGFALAAVSPAVVVPGALSLKKGGFGVVKGVPTLLIASSSIDDVLAISLYSICLGFAIKDTSSPEWQVFSGGAIGMVVGMIHGTIFGIFLHFIPPRNSRSKAEHRLGLLLLINLCSVMAYEETFYSSAGSISVLVTSFIAGFGWRSQPHWKRPMKKIEKWLARIWVLWVPLLFGTIGKEINLKSQNFRGVILGKTFGIISISLVVIQISMILNFYTRTWVILLVKVIVEFLSQFRLIAAFGIVFIATHFNFKECIFVALSWIPKATVQAALAPLVLLRASESDDEHAVRNATLVVNVAILAVLITAPAGSVLIAFLGPRLLELNKEPEIIEEVEAEFPNGEGIDPAESTYVLVEMETKKMRKSDTDAEQVLRQGSGEVVIKDSSKGSEAVATKV